MAIGSRELVRETCETRDIEIVKGHVRPDRVHLLLSGPPSLAPSREVKAFKGKSSS
ncbi:MAG: transposase [Candidatus Wallbacteria bacterium]|nr:transposase [Candidatus Wallbacteria bacterium]